MNTSQSDSRFNRRTFLKASGASGAIIGSAGLGCFGYASGKDSGTYTGWQSFEGADQTFNRTKWEVDNPTYKKTGQTSRPDARTEVIFNRRSRLRGQLKEGIGINGFDELLKKYYKMHPGDYELDELNLREIMPKRRRDSGKYSSQYILTRAWSSAMGAVSPRRTTNPPEISDFSSNDPLRLKNPEKTSLLIKKIAHELGSTLVGIAALNTDWVYLYPHRNRGFENDMPIDVPEHWKYAVVVGVPMSWDPMYANPTYGTSNDAYSLSRIIAHRLAHFIKQLGYAARPHTPPGSYDLMVPPICVDAGLGEQGRHSIVITPELGCNFRPAVVTTNIPVKPDKPIDIGIQDFCKTCKICAENCPNGAITTGEKVEVRGYLRYQINQAKCLNFWNSNLGNTGCRLCVAVCPFTRKANWLHKTALNVSLYDPTGISDKLLTGLQKWLYKGPDTRKYYIPSLGGENATYREPPWWLKTEDFIDV